MVVDKHRILNCCEEFTNTNKTGAQPQSKNTIRGFRLPSNTLCVIGLLLWFSSCLVDPLYYRDVPKDSDEVLHQLEELFEVEAADPWTGDLSDTLQNTRHEITSPNCPYGDTGICDGTIFYFCNAAGQPDFQECAVPDQCIKGSCVQDKGCVVEKLQGIPCDDGNKCTTSDTCDQGVCKGEEQLVCNDNNPCTIDTCIPEQGCAFIPTDGIDCDDGLDCTIGDRCISGVCVPVQNLCNCQTDADCAYLDDSNPCNGVLICNAGLCQIDPDSIPDCSMYDSECKIGVCNQNTGLCEPTVVPDGTPCNDNNLCTVGDSCSAGICLGKVQVVCEDQNPCTEDYCIPEVGCVYSFIQGNCSDKNACTLGDYCANGLCVPGPQVLECDDNNPCTTDTCDPSSGCVYSPAPGSCNDGDPCTINDTCVDGVCTGDLIQCNEDEICIDGQCQCTEQCEEKCTTDAQCEKWQDCQEKQCIDVYPPPPYGSYEGDTLRNHQFTDPTDEQVVEMKHYFANGKVMLLTFSAGWCIVCKQDTSVFNDWHEAYWSDGLRIVSVLYETVWSEPITAEFALWWIDTFDVQYPLYMDHPVAAADGTATGGELGYYIQPTGPIPPGTFPVTLVVCLKNMKILYISSGFHEEEVKPLLMEVLYADGC